MKYTFNSFTSKTFWLYIFSREGIKSMFAIFGVFLLIIESLDFFNIYSRGMYAKYFLLILIFLTIIIAIFLRRPVKSISISFPKYDFNIDVRIIDLFDVNGAVMISSNTLFEADVAGGKIAVDSLQGQFTAKYFTGNQNELIQNLNKELKSIGTTAPYSMGTTIPINTHGKTFYFTAMAEMGVGGNAFTSTMDIKKALNGLWEYVREYGELQELAVPVVGTGRGRVRMSRKRIIGLIAKSFYEASIEDKFSNRLIIAIRPEDAENFNVNLYEIKDYLLHLLK